MLNIRNLVTENTKFKREIVKYTNVFQYESIVEFLTDLRRMFKNCKTFWKEQPSGEDFMRHADTLKAQLDKVLKVFNLFYI